MSLSESKYFLPYQIRWIKDYSQVKLWEKSRRIGATYIQSYEDVRDIVKETVPAVWFTSADESAAKEYILYCEKWAKVFNVVGTYLGEIVIDEKKGIKALVMEFANGKRIHALSSNPKAFRSKGGKVVIDEYAFHSDDVGMWKAAKPTATWGFPVRILSTHNGKQTQFFRFVDAIKKGKNKKWSLHTVDIFTAVKEGLADKIKGRVLTKEERAEWLKEVEEDAFDEITWQEEYCCIPVDEATAFFSYDLISSIEDDNVLYGDDWLNRIIGDLYIGYDVGRRKDLAVMWAFEQLGDLLYTRKVKVFDKARFRIQEEYLESVFSHPNFRRACIDETGIGMELAENMQDKFGQFRIEKIYFTSKVKEEMAYACYTKAQDKRVLIPHSQEIREDFHSIRKVTTAANNIRFDVAKTSVTGHADRFWSFALANHAAANANNGPVIVKSRGKRESSRILRGYYD